MRCSKPNLLCNNMTISKQQLIDSLTSHISLYNSHSATSSNPNPRSSILKWFSSLTVHQRQAYLTTVDSNFTQLLFRMLRKLKSNGHGVFIILPDIPDSTTTATAGSSLPSVCFRKSHGLLSRVAENNEAERLIRDAVRLFDSKEGEGIDACSCSANCLDSLTVSEDLVGSVDTFVGAMDGVSNGGFLRGEESCIGSEWVELDWLKAKGYYSVEAFMANRLEVTLRLSWLNCTNGKKRGVKLKDKVNFAGVAANTFWRKKGCIDWWEKLDEATKGKVFKTALGKLAKSLAAEIVKGRKDVLDDNVWHCGNEVDLLFRCNTTTSYQECPANFSGTDEGSLWNKIPTSVSGMPSSLICILRGLSVLQNISTMLFEFQHTYYERERLYFSSLESISSISDCILRRLRVVLMVISLECTKVELLDDGKLNSSFKKNKEKVGPGNNKKSRKNRKVKKPNPVPKLSTDDVALMKSPQDDGFRLARGEDGHICTSSGLDNKLEQMDFDRDTIPSTLHTVGNGKGQNTNTVRSVSRKKRGRSKRKNPTSKISAEAGNCEINCARPSTLSEDGDTTSACISENSVVENSSKVVANEDHNVEPISSCSGAVQMDSTAQLTKGCHSTGCAEGSKNPASLLCQTTESMVENKSSAVALETTNQNINSGVTSVIPVIELGNNLVTHDMSNGNCNGINRKGRKHGVTGKQTNVGDQEAKIFSRQERGSIDVYNSGPANASTYLSYEWPSVAPIHFPSGNSHLPPATDRLHLDVSHNWQSHYHQSYVRTVHHVRNSSIESGRTGIISRPLAMSLDWPPILRGVNGVTPSVTCNYDTGFISRRPSSFQQDLATQGIHCKAMSADDERVYSGEFFDFSDPTNTQEVCDEHDNHRMSEEELEVHGLSGVDYNQYFGGGVMYWDPSDYLGTSFSRPPSLSSDDSSWAWREADMSRAVDDMVAFSSSYSTNGLTSPSATPFCSPFDPLGSGTLSYVIPGSEVNSGKVPQSSSTPTDLVGEENASASLSNMSVDSETKAGDTLPYPILRPIIIPNMSRERSRSDFRRSHDRTSPCIPPNRQEQPRIKRPPSPVVLCVPRAPRLPPPSPVGDSRRHRVPTVRSGSTSPRHWGMKGWLHDGINFEEACIRMDGSEVVWPSSWRSKSFSGHQLTQPLTGALLQDHLIALSQLTRDQEHPDVSFPVQPPEMPNCSAEKASLSLIHNHLHDEIDAFCKQVAAENLIRKPYINWAVKRVTRSLQVLWPRSRTNIFGSNATGLSLPSSDVDLVVCLPPVRNLEPIKEAGILEGRNGIKETCLQHAARYLANQEWVKNDSLKIVENTAIPIIMLVVEVPHDFITSSSSHSQTPEAQTISEGNPFQADGTSSESSTSPKWPKMNDSGKDVKSVRLDISFKSPSHTGLQTSELVKELTEQFPAAKPLALVLKQFLADRSLDQSYSGGLSSYCLVLLITRFLQHEHHHGRSTIQNYGSLLMDFLYFFGNVFDPRQMRVSIQGSGLYINRERGYSIDPIYIDDPLFPTNNVGRNCFRIHQCIKAFADAYSTLESEITLLPSNDDSSARMPSLKLLPKVIPSIMQLEGFQLSGD
ncbi:PREDICTED: uncharacterized protein LOC109156008 isoform X1 [Ipomoea nil]|uniref:uncharacterized protein LOC109156008 isoform X1 n=1 Tax=Ipomoea nil TaxID=35883 RepID=UPI000900FB7E|nr:PREDICTED: uncharacterized protein LOC109156008 isoform X1 [Ipomoea nil]XP_019159313.1 PREDICTED: uncharacterized protein LOC109156008 isoform X1 [Ipomoea nil]XP_019159314.1 PREDICTED: uncharacterized protein LOC109156008 isoform X1 [Ipomoea nil]XP_019159315.1 PREDICTED: uncharacterized protein LOC109156008 isoform X1 [Ipomoea nil]XP_019159316.1 PREDICTED: uncharacterized protein LOC109156008 isoform X1 [Ipomoea nil]XP_019159317.1 PREDICTED: uncharacterized protein LOC109156008 isoform X1 [